MYFDKICNTIKYTIDVMHKIKKVVQNDVMDKTHPLA